MVFLVFRPFIFSMRALVMGGTGFIGSHLVDELLQQGYAVRVLRRATSNMTFLEGKTLETTIGDLTDIRSLKHACRDIDVVFHVAALPRDWGSRKEFFEVNLYGTKNLLDSCVENKVPRFVFMSSAAVYGFPKTTQPIGEDFPKRPTPKYGESKYRAELLLWEYGMNYNMEVSAIRSPLVTGPRDTLIAPFLIKALQQKQLFYIGTGDQKISISDGRDVARCLRLAGEASNKSGQAYNVKSYDCTPKLLIEKFAELLHVPAPTTHRSYLQTYLLARMVEDIWTLRGRENPPLTCHKVKVLGHTRLLDIRKAAQQLRYIPQYAYESSIKDTIAWYTQSVASALI
jgi:nucleoside-diphosphate-sugar epimerase